MNASLIEDAKRHGYISEIMRRQDQLQRDVSYLLSLISHTHSYPHTHTYSNSIAQVPANATVPAGTTYWTAPFYTGLAVAEFRIPWPIPGTCRNMYVRISNAQPASGSLVITVRKNGVSQSLVVTIAAGSAGGTYSNTTNSFTIVAGDLLSVMVVNNAAAASAQIPSIVFELGDIVSGSTTP